MATSGLANWFSQHGLENALSIATYIISSDMSVLGASIKTTNLEIMSLLTSNTPSGITTYIKCSAMPTPNQPTPNSLRTMFADHSKCFYIFPVSCAISRSPPSSIEWWSACRITSRCWFSTLFRCTNGSTSTMQSGYMCLLSTTSHQKLSHMSKFLNGRGKRWRKWAGTCLEL